MPNTARLLIVDDEELLARQLQKYLSRHGFTVAVAFSAGAALALLQEQSFDVLVSDLNMPVMNGVELIKRAKPIQPQLKFIIVSANKSPDIHAYAQQLGIIAFLYKPLSLDELLDAIAQGLSPSTPR